MPRATSRNEAVDFPLWWSDMRQSIALLTRISHGEPSKRSMASAMRAFPIVGVLIGLLGGLAFGLAEQIGLSAFLAAVVTTAALLWLTGCFHEDGLADTADGLGGGMTRDAKLAIMRDSRIGTYGVAALVIALALRIGTLVQISDFGGWSTIIVVLAASGAWSRALMVVLLGTAPPARAEGLSVHAGTPSRGTLRQALLLGGLIAGFLILWCFGFWTMIVALLASYGAFALVRRQATKHIGGQTGDIAGAVQQASEIVFLLCIAAMVP